MEHTARDGSLKIVERCTLPLTGVGVVNLVVTELTALQVTPAGLRVLETGEGVTIADVQARTGARLIVSGDMGTF
jgi:3-oxoacid CoA-transferase subunit B